MITAMVTATTTPATCTTSTAAIVVRAVYVLVFDNETVQGAKPVVCKDNRHGLSGLN